MEITIDGKKYTAQPGETILDVCRKNNIPVPALCSFEGLPKDQVCRLCLVEVNVTDKLVTACGFPVCPDLKVITTSEKVEKARKINMELLWADHAGKCSDCSRNLRCEFQKMAQKYRIENFHFIPRKGDITPTEEIDLIRDNKTRAVFDKRNPAIRKKGDLCLECRRCINVCPTKEWSFSFRGSRATVSTPYNKKLDCMMCGQCVKICPTASLDDNSDAETYAKMVDRNKRYSVIVVDPGIFSSIQSEIPGINDFSDLKKILLSLGFEAVESSEESENEFIENLASKIMAEGEEMFWINCCPAISWLNKNDENRKQFIDIDLPEKIAAKKIMERETKKNKISRQNIDIYLLSPCTAKKAFREEIFTEVLSARDLGRLYRLKNNQNEKKSARNKSLAKSVRGRMQPGFICSRLENIISNQDNIEYRVVCGWAEFRSEYKIVKSNNHQKIVIEAWVCPGGCAGGGGQAREIE